MTTQKYNAVQTTFALNWLSNGLANVRNTPEKLQSEVTASTKKILADSQTQGLIGNWDVVWGPVVYTNNPNGKKSIADNTMMLLKSQSGDKYVLSIAGTNPISPYGWFIEDFNTGIVKQWPFQDNADLKISAGTYIGIQHLLQMTDTFNGQQNVSIVDCLSQIVKDNGFQNQTTLTVTGHSLGGALSASMALALENAQTASYSFQPINASGEAEGTAFEVAAWDSNQKMIVGALSSAGATPGNKAWAGFFDDEIGSRAIRIWNSIDVVPHAWQKDMMIQAPHLYYPFVKPNVAVLGLTNLALANSLRSGETYVQIMEQVPGLQSAVNMQLAGNNALASLIENLGKAEVLSLIEKILTVVAKDVTSFSGDNKWIKLLTSPQVIAKLSELILTYLEGNTNPIIKKLISLLDSFEGGAFKNDATAIYDFFNGLFIFLAQLGYQHVTAYLEIIGITEFNDIMKQNKPKSA